MDALRDQLVTSLRGGDAHDTFEAAASAFTPEMYGRIPFGAGRSPWQVVEHMRRAQQDVLNFCRNEDGSYRPMRWPADYWPADAVPNSGFWDASVRAFKTGLDTFEALLGDPKRDLLVAFPWGEGQTLLREVLISIEHASYHIGQLIELKRLIDAEA